MSVFNVKPKIRIDGNKFMGTVQTPAANEDYV